MQKKFDKLKLLILDPKNPKSVRPIFNEIFEKFKSKNQFEVFRITSEDWKSENFLEKIKNLKEVNGLLVPFRAPEEVHFILQHLPKIQWIQLFGTGIDAYQGLFEEFKQKEIIMSNLKGVSGILLAEFSILGILYFEKKTQFFVEQASQKNWISKHQNIESMEGKKAMVVGLGGIGRQIAKKLFYGFNVKTIAVKRNVNEIPNEVKECVEKVITIDQIEQNLDEIDYLIFSLPGLNQGTILNEQLIQKLKKQIIVVNVGRGDVICEDSLYKGIKNGQIKGAALDVWNQEPLSKESQFYNDKEINERILNYCHRADDGDFCDNQSIVLLEEIIDKVSKGEFTNIVDYDHKFLLLNF